MADAHSGGVRAGKNLELCACRTTDSSRFKSRPPDFGASLVRPWYAGSLICRSLSPLWRGEVSELEVGTW